MKKRSLRLDREVLTANGVSPREVAAASISIHTIVHTLFLLSELATCHEMIDDSGGGGGGGGGGETAGGVSCGTGCTGPEIC